MGDRKSSKITFNAFWRALKNIPKWKWLMKELLPCTVWTQDMNKWQIRKRESSVSQAFWFKSLDIWGLNPVVFWQFSNKVIPRPGEFSKNRDIPRGLLAIYRTRLWRYRNDTDCKSALVCISKIRKNHGHIEIHKKLVSRESFWLLAKSHLRVNVVCSERPFPAPTWLSSMCGIDTLNLSVYHGLLHSRTSAFWGWSFSAC